MKLRAPAAAPAGRRSRGAIAAALAFLAIIGFPACEGARDTAGEPDPAESHEPVAGRWHKLHEARARASLTPEQLEMIETLEAIGYVSGSIQSHARGVTVHERSRVQAGLNFYTSGHGPEAVLIDMDGNEVHRWRYAFDEVWPDHPRKRRHRTQWWRRATLFDNGDVLAIFAGFGIIKVDKDSKLIWAHKTGAHHDVEVMPDGDIYVLTRTPHVVPRVNPAEPILEDFISVLGADGVEKRRVSVLEAFENSGYAHLWHDIHRRSGDIFHTNGLSILEGRIADRLPAFRRGNVLISLHTFDTIAVVDLDAARVTWALQGDYRGQHDPKILENGNLLLFDNYGTEEQSSVIELDPTNTQTVWQYRGTPERPFYSFTCGTADRLANGNTVITESDFGRAFEVTPDREIVWEYYNPHRAGERDEFIATLFDLKRLPPDFPSDWVRGTAGGQRSSSR
jgi:hypothetical protein